MYVGQTIGGGNGLEAVVQGSPLLDTFPQSEGFFATLKKNI
jgi:hypothetical protein